MSEVSEGPGNVDSVWIPGWVMPSRRLEHAPQWESEAWGGAHGSFPVGGPWPSEPAAGREGLNGPSRRLGGD